MLAARIEQMRPEIDAWSKGFQAVKRGDTPSQVRAAHQGENTLELQKILKMLSDFSQEEKQKIATRIEILLKQEDISSDLQEKLKIFKIAVKLSLGS